MLKLIKVFIKSLTHKKISYSYGGVDLLILDIFKNQKKGYYLDIGCAHPIKNNNTYLLYRKGWNGINIDLDKENIDLFNSYRKRDFNVTAAVSDKEGETDLYFYHNKSALIQLVNKMQIFRKQIYHQLKKLKLNQLIKF